MRKKLFTLMLTTAIATTMLCGCGNNSSNDNKKDSTADTTPAITTVDDTDKEVATAVDDTDKEDATAVDNETTEGDKEDTTSTTAPEETTIEAPIEVKPGDVKPENVAVKEFYELPYILIPDADSQYYRVVVYDEDLARSTNYINTNVYSDNANNKYCLINGSYYKCITDEIDINKFNNDDTYKNIVVSSINFTNVYNTACQKFVDKINLDMNEKWANNETWVNRLPIDKDLVIEVDDGQWPQTRKDKYRLVWGQSPDLYYNGHYGTMANDIYPISSLIEIAGQLGVKIDFDDSMLTKTINYADLGFETMAEVESYLVDTLLSDEDAMSDMVMYFIACRGTYLIHDAIDFTINQDEQTITVQWIIRTEG